MLSSSSCSSSLFSPPSFKPFKAPLFFSLPLRRRRCFLCLASSDNSNNRIESVLFPTITDPASTRLPAVRTYESDLAILSITGSTGANQAVAAAAADGGAAAQEHLSSGTEAMVIETVFPGGTPDGNGTVSTKLFLPAKKVKEKAKKVRKGRGSDTMPGSKNILPMTFRQVVLDQLWSFNLAILAPGSERNMGDLTAPREGEVEFTVSSSDEKFLSSLSEAVCNFMIENIRGMDNKNSRLKSSSYDLSISIHTIEEEDIMNYVMNQSEILNLAVEGKPSKSFLWEPPCYRMLERISSRELVDRMHNFIPAYRLQIMFDVFQELKLEGWHEVAENRWEVLLTHLQMMELANILDIYYEDQYTLPTKNLLCRPLSAPVNATRNTGSFLKVLFATITGFFVIGLLGLGARVFGAHLSKPKVHSQESFDIYTPENNSGIIFATNIDLLEESCKSVVKKIKEAHGSSGDIMFDSNMGAWIGAVPSYLRGTNQVHHDVGTYTAEEISNGPSDLGKIEPEIEDAAQDIASFQVVLSEGGEIVGFQPTSRVAVSIWASHPLAKELYKGRKLTPGILESNVKIPRPEKVVLIELLMSTNPDSFFALARPIKEPCGLMLAKG
ncbi:Deneddylase ORF24 [Rhynchospora pubera]|uniref:Deneddylase ORF24 n=1 Tax=Rhynchospora pubera TaxID=906938 RepID=A0AAV8CRR4_9POAL|nr:Deneddylase ORF24 [Rhynchospora pubera]